MGKRAGRLKQALALALALSCAAGNVPCRVSAYAAEKTGTWETTEMEMEAVGNETELPETVGTEETQTGGTEAARTGDSEATESVAGTEETETAESVAGTEETGAVGSVAGTEETESASGQPGENGAGETESGPDPGGQDTEAAGNVSGETEKTGETDVTAGEPEKAAGDPETEGPALLSGSLPDGQEDAATGDGAALDADYTDSNGVTYSYYGYADGTAAIHTVTDYEGKDVNIPGGIGGYTVTQVKAGFPFGAKLASLTIPEPVTYIGDSLFWGVEIGTLYYNAAEASTAESYSAAPFQSARIGDFYTGENVRAIPAGMFSQAEFKGSVALTAAEVESSAFIHAEFEDLTLTDLIGTLHANAFANAEIQSLHYNTHAAHAAGGVTESAFYQARIHALDFGENVTELPGYAFSGAYFYFNEFTCGLERVGDYAFYSAWPTYDPYYVELTVTENVKYLGAAAFSHCDIRALTMDADLETGAADSLTGAFYASEIGSLALGGNVRQIPDYLFCNAYVTQAALNLDMERIGKYAFYDRTTVTELSIGENVKDIGEGAFASSEITGLHYNAINATVGGSGEMKADGGPFGSVAFSDISFGERVEAIPRCLFTYAKFSVEGLDLPDSVASIGNLAFYALRPDDITVGNLTIGENIGYIGKSAFYGCNIGSLHYRAESTGVYAAEKMGDCPFFGAELGSLEIAEGVTEIPAYLMGGAGLVQDELVIPDSVTKIGVCAFRDKMLGSDIKIRTLVIGRNVSYIGTKAFADSTIQRAVVYAVRADGAYKELSFINMDLPLCTYAEIHTGSDFYEYFTKRTARENITSMCREFGTVYGEEYFDAGRGVYVTPYTKSCVVCGHARQGEDTHAAHTVKFVDYDGRVLSRQDVKSGASAEAPENPARAGYLFTGWDKAFDNVTEDLTVTAQYGIQKFTVTFKDGEAVLKVQEVEYKKSAQPPENPSRPEEEWGTWEFAGWEGNYEAVTEDVAVQAKFIQKWNEYEVIFYDAEGNELSLQSVEHGKAAKAPEPPRKAQDAQHDYVFSGWSGDFTNVKKTLKIYPEYDARTRSYTVTFLDAKDSVLDIQAVEYGSPAAPPEAPQKESTAQYHYMFTGWDHDTASITQDVTARPVYEAKTRRYKVTFADGETVIDEQDVEYGSDAKLPEEPERPEEEWGIWKFVEWIGNFLGITKDETVQAVFEKVMNRYAVTFYDADGDMIETQFVEHGSAAEAPDAPEKEPTPEFAYDFTGWDGDLTNITGTSEFYPLYEERTRSYAVVFLDAEGGILSSQTVEYGGAANAPEPPEKKADAWNTYLFAGWDGDYEKIECDMTLRPVYEEEARVYTVTFKDGETVIDRQDVEAGCDAGLPDDPERGEEEWGSWEFTGWKGNYENVLKDETVEAVFEKELNIYTVIFEDAEGKTISEQEVEHGGAARKPKAPGKKADAWNAYIFTGWDGDTEHITDDAVFRPVYEEKTRVYTVTFKDGETVIDRQDVEAGCDAVLPDDPERGEEEWGSWEFTGWKGNYENVLKDETVEAAFEKELNIYTVIFEDAEGKTISEQEVEHGRGAKLPEEPEKKPDGKHSYTFKGWDGDTEHITDDVTFHPLYTAKELPGGKDPDGKDPDDKKPGDGEKDPGGKDPGDGGKDPDEKKPGDGEEEPDDGGGRKPGPGTTPGDDGMGQRPQPPRRPSGRKPAPGKVTETEETEQEDAEEDTEKAAQTPAPDTEEGCGWLIFAVIFSLLLFLLALILLLFLYGRKKICGTVSKADGTPVEGLRITLGRLDKADSVDGPESGNAQSACTDEEGHYCFAGLQKGSYRLGFAPTSGQDAFSVEIRMDEKGEDIFAVPESCRSLETKRHGRKYIVDINASPWLRK